MGLTLSLTQLKRYKIQLFIYFFIIIMCIGNKVFWKSAVCVHGYCEHADLIFLIMGCYAETHSLSADVPPNKRLVLEETVNHIM